jgi:C4-dicarboxylate-specific signal transduction histidine kinase
MRTGFILLALTLICLAFATDRINPIGTLLMVGAVTALAINALRSHLAIHAQRLLLDEVHAELAHASRMLTLGELAASIVHEVNQPLCAIAANGQACLRWFDREVPDVGAARQSVEGMIDTANRAADIVSGLNALARRSTPSRDSLEINDVLHSVLSLARNEIDGQEITLSLDLEEGPATVLAGRVELEQVVLNLVMNAVQALARIDQPRRLTIVSRNVRSDEHIIVEVRDNGPGFAAAQADRLFEPFYTTKAQGLGMGLAICRSIIASLGGRIDASANEGGIGACLSVRLIRAEAGSV